MDCKRGSECCQEDPKRKEVGYNCISQEDFYFQLLELKRRNQLRLKQLESQYKRRHSSDFVETYLYGDCSCIYASSDDLLDRREVEDVARVVEQVVESNKDVKSRKRRTRSAPALQKKQRTILEPFSMTIREEQKLKEKQLLQESKGIHEEEQESDEEEIINRNFKASSVPKHVSKPLFRNMVIQNPQRYGGDKIMSKYLNSSQLTRKSQSMSDLNHFKAKPFPNHIFTNYAYERMKEAEEYRRVRRETRQKVLMSEASFPSRMKSELEGFKGKFQNSSREPTKRVRMKAVRSHEVPDFDLLYAKFQKSLELKKMTGKRNTVIRPFSFDGKYPKGVSTSTPEKQFSFCKPAPVVFDSIQRGKTTNTARVREMANRSRIESMEYDTIRRKSEQRQLHLRQKELRSHPEWTSRLLQQPNTEEEIRIRTLQRMEDEKERMVSYKMELKRIYDKVNSRPPLFIRQSQQSGARKVERVYNNALSREGLTEKEILQFLSGNQKSRSYDVLPTKQHLNLTYSKSSLDGSSSDLSSSTYLDNYQRDLPFLCDGHREFCSLKSKEL